MFTQHTPVIPMRWRCGIRVDIENNIPEFPESAALKRFGEKVSKHVGRRAVDNLDFPSRDAISDKRIADVDVSGALAAGAVPVLFQEHCALVILVDDGVSDAVALSLQKIACPEDLRHDVIDADEFSLGGAFGV